MIPLKTRSEKKFTDLVISMIMKSNKSMEEKEKCIKSFFNNHSYYYENMCYNVYHLTLLPGTNVLTIDEQGVTHINIQKKDPDMDYFDILTLNEFTPHCSDVIMHIDVALSHLYDLVKSKQSC